VNGYMVKVNNQVGRRVSVRIFSYTAWTVAKEAFQSHPPSSPMRPARARKKKEGRKLTALACPAIVQARPSRKA